MKVDRQGITSLQQMLAQEDIEATRSAKLTASNLHRGHQTRHHAHLHGAGEAPEADVVLKNPVEARLRALMNRRRTRQGRDAESPHAGSSAGELDELLMILEEHANGKTYPVIRASSQKKNDRQDTSSEHSAAERHQGLIAAKEAARKSGDHPQVRRDGIMRNTAVIAPAPANGMGSAASYADLETALLNIRAIKAGPAGHISLGDSILRVMRDFLAGPAVTDSAPGTLKAVREHLTRLVSPIPGTSDPGLRRMHFFLPILLLNASRPRTLLQRKLAIAKIATILRRCGIEKNFSLK
jgi:hypothetical protein